jgi:hypothetical protein
VRAFQEGRLALRRNLHVGVGFLTATNGVSGPGRLRFRTVVTRRLRMSTMEAGIGPPALAIHGLGGPKGSFLLTVAAMSDRSGSLPSIFPDSVTATSRSARRMTLASSPST